MNMSRSHALSLRSPIGILSLHEALVPMDTLAQTVVDQFQQFPYLPGIIVTKSTQETHNQDSGEQSPETPLTTGSIIAGVLSRQLFFERGCLESGDRGWDQPIQNFLHTDQDPPLIVCDQIPILEVALQLRQRPRILSLEPVVVTFRDGSLRLIDSRDILFAQSQIFSEEGDRNRAKDQMIQDYRLQVEGHAQVLEDLHQMINVRNITLQNQQRHLERQQSEIFHTTEAKQLLINQLSEIQKILESKVRLLFQGRLELVATIATSTDQLMRTDISLAKELEVVIALSETLQQVSRQARFLKLHSAIFINRNSSTNLSGFSQVTQDIERLMSQTADADQRVSDSVGHIKLNITELAHTAQKIARATESLIQQMDLTDELLAELETLSGSQHPYESLLTLEQNSGLRTVRMKMRSIENVSQELGELYKNEKPYNLRALLQTLESRLRRH